MPIIGRPYAEQRGIRTYYNEMESESAPVAASTTARVTPPKSSSEDVTTRSVKPPEESMQQVNVPTFLNPRGLPLSPLELMQRNQAYRGEGGSTGWRRAVISQVEKERQGQQEEAKRIREEQELSAKRAHELALREAGPKIMAQSRQEMLETKGEQAMQEIEKRHGYKVEELNILGSAKLAQIERAGKLKKDAAKKLAINEFNKLLMQGKVIGSPEWQEVNEEVNKKWETQGLVKDSREAEKLKQRLYFQIINQKIKNEPEKQDEYIEEFSRFMRRSQENETKPKISSPKEEENLVKNQVQDNANTAQPATISRELQMPTSEEYEQMKDLMADKKTQEKMSWQEYEELRNAIKFYESVNIAKPAKTEM